MFNEYGIGCEICGQNFGYGCCVSPADLDKKYCSTCEKALADATEQRKYLMEEAKKPNWCSGCGEPNYKCYCKIPCPTCNKTLYQCTGDSEDGRCPGYDPTKSY